MHRAGKGKLLLLPYHTNGALRFSVYLHGHQVPEEIRSVLSSATIFCYKNTVLLKQGGFLCKSNVRITVSLQTLSQQQFLL